LRDLEQELEVTLLYVAPVLAQVNGDAVGARLLGDERSDDRIGVTCPARLPNGRNVVHIDAEQNGWLLSH
jgi:hypothetical protein